MSRRPSVLSVTSSTSALGNGHPDAQKPLASQPDKQPRNSPRSMSLSKFPNDNVDPDELFIKHTVSEVKYVQQQLRADADAKQEELRLMVGERYRDLLQASTSIISIARSSRRVLEALEETKAAILAQEAPPLPRKTSHQGSDDTHLRTLQLLSAHMKLLLDAPEHLWRLIERKKYFPAAWLFLLARVVYRALVRDDEQDEETWSSQGIDVLEQFPLVQRQWDAVSQFRSQIIHKAQLSLREYTTTSEDTCATLLTLHLLDSRPLAEMLSVLLGQRSKTLQKMLSWTSEKRLASPRSPSQNRQTNGHAHPRSDEPGPRKSPAKEVKEATQTALGTISQTIRTARYIFQEDNTHRSLIGRILEYIQSDSSESSTESSTLPAELYLTTEALLTTLPSSTHLLLLPSNLKAYKPYVDINSSSSAIPRTHLAEKVDEWFLHSSASFQKAIQGWFFGLQSVKEVWNIRSSTQHWISTSGLTEQETTHLIRIVDDACRTRALGIWKAASSDADNTFRSHLESSVSSLLETSNTRRKDTSLIDFLFQAPPLPVISQSNLGSQEVSFQKYKAALRRQLVGRSTMLEEVLFTLENCARTIQQDLSHVMSDGSKESRLIVDELTTAYQPDAVVLCNDVVKTLESAVGQEANAVKPSLDGLVFLAQVVDELASSSSFAREIGCGQYAITDFQGKVRAIHDRILDRWRKHTVSRIVHDHRLAFRSSYRDVSTASPSGPSPTLVQSLFSLSNSIQRLGVSRDQIKGRTLSQSALRLFVTDLVGAGWETDGSQGLCDLVFLRRLADLQGGDWADVSRLLDDTIKQNLATTTEDQDNLERVASEAVARTQTLFAPFLPPPLSACPSTDAVDKFAALLPYGTPAFDQQYQSAGIDFAKPTSRFGLLLVGGNTGGR